MNLRSRFFMAPIIFIALAWTAAGWAHDGSQQWTRLENAPCEALLEGVFTQPTRTLVEKRALMIENYWLQQFEQRALPFQEMRIAIFSGSAVSSANTEIVTKIGPVYDRGNQTIYFDPAFVAQAVGRVGPGTDTLTTLMLAHEAGHHIQFMRNVFHSAMALALQKFNNDAKWALRYFMPRLELQADCLAGVFFGDLQARGLATPNQVSEAEGRFALLGDDVQMLIRLVNEGALVFPDYNHPNARDRQAWFVHGVNHRRMEACETFDEPVLTPKLSSLEVMGNILKRLFAPLSR